MISKNIISFCLTPELIENYDKAIADTTQTWQCHHRLETHFSDGTERPYNACLSYKELTLLGCYYDRSADELIFLTEAEHKRLHNKRNKNWQDKIWHKGNKPWNTGKTFSEEAKKKMSEAKKGKPSWNKGKKMSEEFRKKDSEAHRGRLKGTHWFTNGKVNVRVKECPDAFRRGRCQYIKK